jgi:hypothetical protein
MNNCNSSAPHNSFDQYIHWRVTLPVQEALAKLRIFYDYCISTNSAIAPFLSAHCSHLLLDSPGFLGKLNTGYLKNCCDANVLLTGSVKGYDCAELTHAGQVDIDITQSYVYTFIHKESKDTYIGSTYSAHSRIRNYISSWSKSRHRFLNYVRDSGGLRNYLFYPVISLSNYRSLFYQHYPGVQLTTKEQRILDSFTEFEVRTVEQALIYSHRPPINDWSRNVSFTSNVDISKWTPGEDLRAHPIEAYTKSGELFIAFPSIFAASRALGINEISVTSNRNIDYYIYCPGVDKTLRFGDPVIVKPIDARTPSMHLRLSDVTSINLNGIRKGVVTAIFSDKITVYGEYASAAEFAAEHNLNSWQAYRYINKEWPIMIAEDEGVYLCVHPETRAEMLDTQDKKNRPVVAIDTDGTEYLFTNPHSPHSLLTLSYGESRREQGRVRGEKEARLKLTAMITNMPESEVVLKPTRNFTKDYITGVQRNNRTVVSRFGRRFILFLTLSSLSPTERAGESRREQERVREEVSIVSRILSLIVYIA